MGKERTIKWRERGQTLFCVTCCCLLRYSDCGCGPAYKFVTLDADPHHKSQRPETCTVRYHGNYCALNAFEIELHWIAATGCIVNDMVRKLNNEQIAPLKCVGEPQPLQWIVPSLPSINSETIGHKSRENAKGRWYSSKPLRNESIFTQGARHWRNFFGPL